MPNSHASSHVSAPCRLEWRPSRWLTAALLFLAAGAALSAMASDLPVIVSVPMALFAAVYGAWLAARERARPVRQLVATPDMALWRIDGEPMPGLRVDWRGALLFVRWESPVGRACLVWWPDTLSPPQRRELRLAAPSRGTARDAGSMAP